MIGQRSRLSLVSLSWRLLLPGALLAFASSCFLEDLFGPSVGPLRGGVFDRRDGQGWQQQPVAGVVVRLSGAAERRTTTDANGRFEFADLEPDVNYQVSLDLDEGASHPASFVAAPLGRRGVDGLVFSILPGGGHRLEGSVEGAPDALVSTCCVSIAFGLVWGDGTFGFDHLPFLPYEIRASTFDDDTGFTPDAILVNAILEFVHPQAGDGTLGSMTVSRVTSGAADVSGCFDISITGDGTGTIRVRRESEIAWGISCSPDPLWLDYTPAVVTLASDLGPLTISLHPFAWYGVKAASADFSLTERLVPASPLHFTFPSP